MAVKRLSMQHAEDTGVTGQGSGGGDPGRQAALKPHAQQSKPQSKRSGKKPQGDKYDNKTDPKSAWMSL